MALHRIKVRWRFCKIFWPSHNIWPLPTFVLKLQTWIYNYIRHSNNQGLDKSIPYKYLGSYLIFYYLPKIGEEKGDQSGSVLVLFHYYILNRYLLCLKAISPGFVFWSKMLFVKRGEVHQDFLSFYDVLISLFGTFGTLGTFGALGTLGTLGVVPSFCFFLPEMIYILGTKLNGRRRQNRKNNVPYFLI